MIDKTVERISIVEMIYVFDMNPKAEISGIGIVAHGKFILASLNDSPKIATIDIEAALTFIIFARSDRIEEKNGSFIQIS